MLRRSFLTLLSVMLLCGLMASLALALNYQYFSNLEEPAVGEHDTFWHGDTLAGPVRSNDKFAISEDPVFGDFIISTAEDFWHGPGYQPQFLFNSPYFQADSLRISTNTNWLRGLALAQNRFYVGDMQLRACVRMEDHNLHVLWGRRTVPFDTLLVADYPLADSAVVFFDFPEVYLSGTVNSILILGASGRIGLEDNVLYASSNPASGQVTPGHTEKLAVVAEGEMKVLNTWANGRENSHGQGDDQTDPDSTNIALNGLFVALGESFTFDQQNDPDSGYVYTENGIPHRDDRGSIYLYGDLIQMRRGRVHRSNNGSTGYHKNYRYDNDLKFWNLPFFSGRENELDRTSVDFGPVAVGDTLRDTLTVYNDFVPLKIDSLFSTTPFAAALLESTYVWHPRIAVAFAPQSAGIYETVLTIPIPYYNTSLAVTLRGTCTASGIAPRAEGMPKDLTLSASPNPFNAATRIAFTLPVAENVSLRVYDLLGREQATLAQARMAAGTHERVWEAGTLPGGLYFVRLTTSSQDKTTKLLLLK